MTGLGRYAVVAALVAAAASACGSTRSTHAVSNAGTTATTTPVSTTTAVSLEVTVPDCGAGAYRPATLLIVCANGGTMATDIRWASWGPGAANGVGTVHLQAGQEGSAEQVGDANLELSDVVDTGAAGPRFTRLTVSWIGRSPDGRTSDTFQLGS